MGNSSSDRSGRGTTSVGRTTGATGAADPEALVGTLLGGRYQIERLLGEGGMGAVYLAEHTHMRKRVAVKILHPEMGRLAEVVARFEREAMAAANMEHPNVAGATDFGKLEDGSFFLVLEYVEGTSLRDVIAKGRLDLSRALHIVRQIASALSRAHALGIVHRDVKPENIMLVKRESDSDFVKMLDFGIAKVPIGEIAAGGPSETLTQLGMVYGTPEYMAPEQALGQPVDARADLYALGVMAFEMITGKRPYQHESKVTLLGMHVAAPIPSMSERAPDANVPADVEAIVTRLLSKDSAQRFPSARDLVEALDAVGPSASAALLPTQLTAHASGSPGRLTSLVGASLRGALDAAPPWAKSGRAMALGTVLGVVGIAAVVVVAMGRRGSASMDVSAHHGADATHADHDSDTATDGAIAAAQANLDRGDFATAIDSLTAVEKRRPDRADVHLLLERAYTGVRNGKDAVREAALVLSVDPSVAVDLKLQEDVRNAALVKETQEDAFSLLESKMGARGIDILYDVAFGTAGRMYPQAAVRARRSLENAEVRGRGSPALAVLLDFRDAKTCDDRHALLDRARDQGDSRLLSVLKPYESTRGCGFLGRSDCYPCMHKDRAVTDAIASIQTRGPH
jgi:tRNA A-37 threonylcarbamoyl transferase component Bud32